MNDLDSRLEASNPVPREDVRQAAITGQASELLQRILKEPITADRRQATQLRWSPQAWIAVAAAIAVAAVGITATVLGGPPRRNSAHSASPRPIVTGFQRGPSQGVAKTAVELVDYAVKAAAMAPVFMPGPRDWIYTAVLYKGKGIPPKGIVNENWLQIGTTRAAARTNHSKLTFGAWGGPSGRLTGWPGNSSSLYRYLASLPARPGPLRKVILANNHSDPTAAFTAINVLMRDYPLPPRFQAELYAVLVSLPDVHFSRHAVDVAGRHGVGLYMFHDGYLSEIIINPRTYVFMGGLAIPVRAHTAYRRLLAHPGTRMIVEAGAILGSGIVSRAGQLP